MKMNKEFELADFDAWSGAVETKDTIIENGKEKEFEQLLNDLYPEGLSETEINDLLWFEDEWIFETLGIEIED